MDDDSTPSGSPTSNGGHLSPSVRRSGRVPVKRKLYIGEDDDETEAVPTESRKKPKGSKAKAKASTPEAEANGDEEQTNKQPPQSDGDSSLSELSESEPEEEVQPQKKARGRPKGSGKGKTSVKSQKKAAVKGKKAAASNGQEEESEEFSIFDIVLNHPNALDATVTDWLDTYREDSVDAMLTLVQFVIEATGCPGKVSRADFEDGNEEAIPEIVSSLEEQFDLDKQQDYPLIAKGKGRSPITKFRKHFTEFWTKWVHKLNLGLLYDVDNGCIEKLLVWLVPMSSSTLRPLRHTSAAVALIMHSALCDIAREVEHEWRMANRQLAAEEKKGGARKSRGGANQREEQLRATSEELHSKKMQLERHLQDLFDSFFVHRYRDINPVIRVECIRELGSWIEKFPDYYLDPTYLRYIGWLLSDKVADVRQEALRSLGRLYAVESLRHGLRPFTERFKDRIITMACRDAAVRTEAVITVRRIADAGLLDEDDCKKLLRLMYDDNEKVRELASPLISQIWTDDYLEKHQEKARAALGPAYEDDVKARWVELKAFCQVLIEQCENMAADGRVAVAAAGEESNGAGGKQTTSSLQSSQSGSQTMSLSQSQNDLFDEEEYENDGDAEERKKELVDLYEWAKRLDDVSGDLLDQRVAVAVAGLWDQMEFLHDWKSISDYLAADLTSDDASQTLSPILGDLSQTGIGIYRLSEQEESCLLYVLVAVLDQMFHHQEKDEETHVEVVGGIFKVLPKLFQKYGGEYGREGSRRVVQVLRIVRYLDLGLYLELRMLKMYDALFDDIKRVFLNHADREVLSECTDTLQYLMGQSADEAKSAEPVKTPKKGGPKKTVDMDVDEHNDTSTTSLHNATKQKVEELTEELANTQLGSQLAVLKSSLEENADSVDLKLLYGLQNATVRLDELLRVVDVVATLGNDPIKGDEGTQWESVSEVLIQVLEVVVTLASKDLDTLFEKGLPNGTSSLTSDGETDGNEGTRVLNELLEAALNGLGSSATWQLQNIHASLPPKLEAAGGKTEEDEEGTPSPEEFPSEETREKFQPFLANSQRVTELAEAIIDVTDDGPKFTVSAKLAAMKSLLFQRRLVNGLVLGKYAPESQTEMDESVQKDMVGVLMKAVEVFEFTSAKRQQESVSFETLTPAQKDVARNFVLFLAADVTALIKMEDLNGEMIVHFAQYFGVVDHLRDEEVGEGRRVPVLGGAWDGLTESAVRDVVVGRVKELLEEFETDVDRDDEAQVNRALHQIQKYYGSACEVMFDSLKKSLDHYQSVNFSFIDPTLSLAKVIISCIKAWTDKDARDAIRDKAVCRLLVNSALDLLKRGAEDMVDAVASWSSAHGGQGRSGERDIEDMEILERGQKMRRGDLESVNAGWRVWGAVGGAVQQLVHSVGGGNRGRGEDGELRSVEDVIEHASQLLLQKGFKPVDTDKDWDGYWAFVKAAEKGDFAVRRRGRPKATKKGSRENTPAASTKRKRRSSAVRPHDSEEEDNEATPKPKKAKTSRTKAGDDDPPARGPAAPGSSKRKRKTRDDDDEEGGRPVPTPSRRSERTKGKPTTYKDDSEEVEEDEEDLIVVSRSAKRARVAGGKGNKKAGKENEPVGDEGIEEGAAEAEEYSEDEGEKGQEVEEEGREEGGDEDEKDRESSPEVPLPRRRK
ncbi:hypothetical protein HK097_004488 [Rhizophlyctis rosea]|uniref:SCD domain-containing protein n=1 Tax=Rhizophlyctis rosea TaxID=64517 RepID=A0AAD5SEV2_9FUNG|nr:hypothetical protein HK097_004488 [Rhizophlyctis rosea]